MIPLDVSDVINDLGEPVSVTQKTVGSFDGGFYIEGGTAEVNVVASVQPLSGREIQLVPEALRNAGTVRIYSKALLSNQDMMTWQGNSYEVQVDYNWKSTGNYYKYYGRLVID